jgi:hypothetical protein
MPKGEIGFRKLTLLSGRQRFFEPLHQCVPQLGTNKPGWT